MKKKKKKRSYFPGTDVLITRAVSASRLFKCYFFSPKFSSKAKTNKQTLFEHFFFSKISPKLKQTTKQKHHEEFLYKYTKL